MLKVKRIAKVMLCICVAFSMFISVYADNIIIEVNDIEGELNQTAGTNNVGINIKYPMIINLTKDNKYNLVISVPDVTVNNYNRKTVSYSPGSWFGDYASIEFNIVGSNIEILSETNVIIENYNYNNEILNITFIINTDITGISGNGVVITYYSFDKGQNFIINEPIKPYVILTELQESNTDILINNINNVIHNIINNINSIFNFVTDKPWIIILGVSVSLISFLIYKAKTII